MKCINCGSELEEKDNKFVCLFCGSTFINHNVSSNEYSVNNGILKKYVGAEKIVVIPEGVFCIGYKAFYNNLIIEKVVLPSTITTIEESAFEGCLNLKELVNYSNIKYFKKYSFKSSGLELLNIGCEVLEIGDYAFSNMSNLRRLYYHPNKNLKLNQPFRGCSNLIEVEMDKLYFFPSLKSKLDLMNNPRNYRPTYGDAFRGTKFLKNKLGELMNSYYKNICPECGGKIKKTIFHAKCTNCGIDYKN